MAPTSPEQMATIVSRAWDSPSEETMGTGKGWKAFYLFFIDAQYFIFPTSE